MKVMFLSTNMITASLRVDVHNDIEEGQCNAGHIAGILYTWCACARNTRVSHGRRQFKSSCNLWITVPGQPSSLM